MLEISLLDKFFLHLIPCTLIPNLKYSLYPSLKCTKTKVASTPLHPYMPGQYFIRFSHLQNLIFSKCIIIHPSDRDPRRLSKLSGVQPVGRILSPSGSVVSHPINISVIRFSSPSRIPFLHFFKIFN